MTRKTTHTIVKIPKLCRHPNGRAYVRIKGKFYYLGKYGTPESQQRYHALLAQLSATGLAVPLEKQPKEISVAEALELYLEHARKYYGKGGKTASQVGRIKAVVMCAMDLYGAEVAADFGPLRLRAVQAELVTRGYCRTNCNAMLGCLKLAFKWLASHELVPAAVAVALGVVPGLRRGKTGARESDPVLPVLEAHIEATRAVLPPTLRAMVDLQLACGARPGEILDLRPCDVDRTGPVWTATLCRHKTEHHGKARTLYFGPKAQAVIRPFMLNRGPADYLFNPHDAEAQRNENAPTRRGPGQRDAPRKTDRVVRDCYDTGSYRRAIARACKAAGVPTWHPHQLRHNAATAVRKAFGLEGAQLILGHSSADVTQIYAEVDREKALEIARQIG